MMCTFVYTNTDLHPTSHILLMDISELCVNSDSICPSMDVPVCYGNSNLHSLVDIVFPHFGSPTVINSVFHVVC